MSFIYAEKIVQSVDGEDHPSFHIMGDTKFTPIPESPGIVDWGTKTYSLLSRYGIVKSMIIGPKCCLSFAGNNIAYAHDLLTFIYTTGKFSVDQMLSRALEIHLSAPKDAIEFLICTVDEREEGHITCVKDGEIKQDCPQAWIGSSEVHKALQAQRDFSISKSEHRFSLSQFQVAIERSCDDSVGGFITNIRYDFYNRTFVYSERLETHTGRDQLVQLGESIRLYDNAADGGYLVHYDENSSAFSLQIDQGDLSIVYVNGTKYDEPHSINDHTKYFMIPILVRTSTWEPIYNTIPAGESE